jgi:hypothetical protein
MPVSKSCQTEAAQIEFLRKLVLPMVLAPNLAPKPVQRLRKRGKPMLVSSHQGNG